MRREASRQELARTAETLRRMMIAGEVESILEVILDIRGARAVTQGAEGAEEAGHGRRRTGAAADEMDGHRGAEGGQGAGPGGAQGAGAHPLPGAEALRRHWDQITCRIRELELHHL